MKRDGEVILVGKNRQRALWSLALIFLAIPVSGWFLYAGLKAARAGIGWTMAFFGLLGLLAFGGYAALVVRTMRSPWHLALRPSQLTLHTPAYDLSVPWTRVAGIAVGEVDRRLGCVLVFDDVAAVVQGAVFNRVPLPSDAVTNPAKMQARMEESFAGCGYHLGIPGQILELGPEALAALLTSARTGSIWQKREQ